MLYCVRMDVRVPHSADPDRFETLKAKEKARARIATLRQMATSMARLRAVREHQCVRCRRP